MSAQRITQEPGPYGMSNAGMTATLPDGRVFRFVWSGTIAYVSKIAKRAAQPDMPRKDLRRHATFVWTGQHGSDIKPIFACSLCSGPFDPRGLYYNRKGPATNKKSRLYHVECAERLGLIEPVKKGSHSNRDAISPAVAVAKPVVEGSK